MQKKAFEGAIEIIRKEVDAHKRTVCVNWLSDLRAAITFLEAGQKVDTERCLILIDDIPMPDLRDELRIKVRGQLRALLSAIPKGEFQK